MLIPISHLISLPIVSSETGGKVATLGQPLIDPSDGQLVAWQVRTSGFLGRMKFLSSNDIIDYGQSEVAVSSAENLVEPGEIIRAKKILEEKIKILGAIAFTEGGKILGKIHDLLFNTELEKVVKFYIRGLFKDRIITADRVVKIEKKGVIFQEDIEAAVEGVVAVA